MDSTTIKKYILEMINKIDDPNLLINIFNYVHKVFIVDI